jgi:hypothetical protein
MMRVLLLSAELKARHVQISKVLSILLSYYPGPLNQADVTVTFPIRQRFKKDENK